MGDRNKTVAVSRSRWQWEISEFLTPTRIGAYTIAVEVLSNACLALPTGWRLGSPGRAADAVHCAVPFEARWRVGQELSVAR